MEVVYDSNSIDIALFTMRLVPSVVINNKLGVPFTQFKTKAIGWVKQPIDFYI